MGYLQRLTVAGASEYAVPDYRRERARALGAAVDVTESALTRYSTGRNNRYSNLLATRVYDSPGIGDVDGDTSWLDIANTFVGAVGTGVSNLIGGKPQTTIINQTPAAKPFPWLTVGAVAGGAGLLFLLMKRRRR